MKRILFSAFVVFGLVAFLSGSINAQNTEVYSGIENYSETAYAGETQNSGDGDYYYSWESSGSDAEGNETDPSFILSGTTMTVTRSTASTCQGTSYSITWTYSHGSYGSYLGTAQYSDNGTNWYTCGTSPYTRTYNPSSPGTYTHYGRVLGANGVVQVGPYSTSVTVNAVPGATSVTGGGTFCSSATLTATAPCSGTTDFGTGTSTSQYYPLYGYYNYSRSLSLILRSEASCNPGVITHLAVYVGTGNTHAFTGINIRLSTTTATSITSTTFPGTGTLVWSGSYTFSTAGWVTFDITDYNWSSDNLLIEWQHGYTSYTSAYPYFRYTTQSANLECYAYSDGALPTTGTLTTNRPNYRLTYVTSSPTVYWQNTTSNGTSTATPSTSQTVTSNGTYYFRARSSAGCWGAQGSQTVTIRTPPTAPTSISGTGTICTGGSVTLTASGGSAGSGCTYQWYAGGCGSGSVLGTGSTLSVSPTSTTTYYVRRVGNSPCDATVTACASGTVTVVPDPSLSAATRTNAVICAGGSSVFSSTLSNGTGTVGYQWQYSPDNSTWSSVVNGTPAGATYTNATTANMTIGGITANGTYYYRLSATSTGNGCTTPVYSASASLVVNQAPTAPTSISGTGTICTGGSLTLTASGGSAGSGCTYQWYAGGCGSGSVLGTGSTLSVSPTSTTTYYVRRVGNSPCDATVTACASGTVTVVADPSLSAATRTNAVICAGGSSVFSSTLSNGTGTVGYQWQYSPDNSTWSSVANGTPAGTTYTNATSASMTISGTTAAGTYYYRLSATSTGNGCTTPVYSASNTLQVVPDPSLSAATRTNAIICAGGSSVFSSTLSNGTGTVGYQWQYSPDNSTWSNVANGTPAGATYTNATTANMTIGGITADGTYYYRLSATSTGNGCTTPVYSASNTLQVVPDPSLSAASRTNAIICAGGSSEFSSFLWNGTGTVGYQWQYSPDNSTWSNVANGTPAGATYTNATTIYMTIGGITANGTYYYRLSATSSGSGCTSPVYSASNTLQVVADPGVVIGPPYSVCVGATQSLNPVFTGGTGTPSYQWQSSPDNSTWSNIGGATASSYSVPTSSSGSTYYRIILNYSGSGCDQATSSGWLVTVVNDPAVSISGGTTVCVGATVSLTSSISGGTGTQSLQWQSSPDNSTWSNISGATSASYSAPTASAGTTYYRLIVNYSGGGCDQATSTSQTVTVVNDPAVTISGGKTACQSSTVNLTSSISGGTGTQSLQWQSSPDNSTWTNISGATSSSYSAPTSSSGTTYYRLVVNYTGSGCTQANSASQTVSVLQTNSWIGETSSATNVSSNWCLSGSTPSQTTDVIIPDASKTLFDPTVSAGVSFYVNNLTIETNGILNTSGLAILVIYGNWTNNGGSFVEGTSNVRFSNGSSHQINSAENFYGLYIYGNTTINQPVTVSNYLFLEGGTLTHGNFLTLSDGAFIRRSDGSIATAPVFGANVDMLYLSPCTTGPEMPYSSNMLRDIQIQVGTGNIVTLSNHCNIKGNLELVSGVLRSSTSALLTLTDGADAIYENNNSFVDGPVSKIGDDAFEFPTGDVVGSTFVWAPIAMADPGSNIADRFTAEYFLQPAPYNWAAGDMCDVTDLNHVSGVEYWEMTRNSGSTYPNLTLYWKDASRSGITDVSQLCVGHRETCTLGHPGWVRMAGSASGSTGVGGTGSATATGFTSYSPITFGTKNNNNPLPVELLEFSASCDGQKVETRWITASETNNDYFTLERSADASRWEYVTRIEGAGNSNQPLSYLYYDENPYEGVSYYRLKQTDFDGATETFDAIAVACISADSYEISIYPNPFKTELILKFRNVAADKANIRFFDLLGSQVMEKEVDIKGIDKLTLDMSFLATGVYYLEFKAGDVNFRTKVVKN